MSRATSCPQDYTYAIAPLGVTGSSYGGARIAVGELRPQKHATAPSGDQLVDYYMYRCDQITLERAICGVRNHIDLRPHVKTSRNGGGGRQLVILSDRPIRSIEISGERRDWQTGYIRHLAWLGPERGVRELQRWWNQAGRNGRTEIEAALQEVLGGDLPRTFDGSIDFPQVVEAIRSQRPPADLADGESRRTSRAIAERTINPILDVAQPLGVDKESTVIYNWGPGAAIGKAAGVLRLGSRRERGGGWRLEAILNAGQALPAAIICHSRGIVDVVAFTPADNEDDNSAIFDLVQGAADLGELALPPGADKVAAGVRIGARALEALADQQRRQQARIERVEATWKPDTHIPGASITVQAPWAKDGVPYTLDEVLEMAEAVARGAGIQNPEAVTAALIADAAEGNRRWQYPARLAQIIDDIRRDQDLGVTDRYSLAGKNGSTPQSERKNVEAAINQADQLLALAADPGTTAPVIDLTDGSALVGGEETASGSEVTTASTETNAAREVAAVTVGDLDAELGALLGEAETHTAAE